MDATMDDEMNEQTRMNEDQLSFNEIDNGDGTGGYLSAGDEGGEDE